MESKNFLIVSEKFTSIQGEGQTMGKKAIFLRLSGCNILCQGIGWVCDSIEVWKKGVKTEFEDIFTSKELQNLKDGYHLVITGGEPLLHQEKVTDYLFWFFHTFNFVPIIEIETNGTIEPNNTLIPLVRYWNVSPKLDSSGAGEKRKNKEAIELFNGLPNSIFKFVISSAADVREIKHDFNINKNKIYLMPAGDNKKDLEYIRPFVVDFCIENGYNYSERLHIVIWNQKTGV